MRITLNNNIQNVSLQVGDIAYFTNGYQTNSNSTVVHAASPEYIGKITAIGPNYIDIANPQSNISSPLNDNDFLMFSKDTRVNKSSLLGYYAEVKLTNESTEKIEMFSLGSEVTQSSK